jgi:hypothetical protein
MSSQPDASSTALSTQRTNPLAIVSLVAGILWLYWIGSVIAVITGFIAFRQIERSRGAQGGRGLAIAGIALGLVGVSIYLTLTIALSG